MNIKCQECGHENQLGAIFCRNCSAKLDIETVRPTVADNKPKANIGALVQRLVMVVIFLIVLGLIAALFIPVGLKKYEAASEDVAKEAKAKVKNILDRIEYGGKGPAKYVFTPGEATEALNFALFGDKPGEAPAEIAGYNIERVFLDVSSSGDIVIDLDTKLGGKVPVRFEIVGKPTVKEGEAGAAPVIGFDISSVSMGHVSVPAAFLKGKIVEKFGFVAQSKDADKIAKALKSFEIDSDGNIAIALAEQKAPAKK
jgi:hypothetical protein